MMPASMTETARIYGGAFEPANRNNPRTLIAGWVPQWRVPCGTGPSCSQQALVILGDIQIPWLSLAAFLAIAAALTIYLIRTRK